MTASSLILIDRQLLASLTENTRELAGRIRQERGGNRLAGYQPHDQAVADLVQAESVLASGSERALDALDYLVDEIGNEMVDRPGRRKANIDHGVEVVRDCVVQFGEAVKRGNFGAAESFSAGAIFHLLSYSARYRLRLTQPTVALLSRIVTPTGDHRE